jgi:cell division protein FtsW (lipid II flippase)
MLAYLTGLVVFLLYYRKRFSALVVKQYAFVLIGLLVIVLGIFANTKVEENFQGRTVGVAQLKENVTSIFDNDMEGGLADNKLWRLAWWYAILSEATEPRNALVGKGIGENLALTSEVRVEDESLRSPHNFHLNVLARFGIFFFGLWIVWIWDHLKQFKNRHLSEFNVLILVFFIAFIINASFDVYLEGPMGALPFWSWLGMLYINDAKTIC